MQVLHSQLLLMLIVMLMLNHCLHISVGLPFGLFLTLVGGGELFTGNTALVTTAVLERKASLRGLAKVSDS